MPYKTPLENKLGTISARTLRECGFDPKPYDPQRGGLDLRTGSSSSRHRECPKSMKLTADKAVVIDISKYIHESEVCEGDGGRAIDC
jgi:hypothetical protein